MARAIELAQRVRTTTSPNPWVGCVVIDAAGEVAGEGATAPPGGPHAEIAALAAGEGPSARRHRLRDARAVRPSGPDPAVHRCSRRRRRRQGRGSDRGPRSGRGGSRLQRSRGGGRRGHDRRARRDRARPAATRTSCTARPAGPSSCSSSPRPSTGGSRPRTARAGGSPGPRRGATSTACAPRATPCSSGRGPCEPTTRS